MPSTGQPRLMVQARPAGYLAGVRSSVIEQTADAASGLPGIALNRSVSSELASHYPMPDGSTVRPEASAYGASRRASTGPGQAASGSCASPECKKARPRLARPHPQDVETLAIRPFHRERRPNPRSPTVIDAATGSVAPPTGSGRWSVRESEHADGKPRMGTRPQRAKRRGRLARSRRVRCPRTARQSDIRGSPEKARLARPRAILQSGRPDW
jgi:hypothetical protein